MIEELHKRKAAILARKVLAHQEIHCLNTCNSSSTSAMSTRGQYLSSSSTQYLAECRIAQHFFRIQRV